MPDDVTRLRICEKMGWTFSEYDNQTAQDIVTALEIWKLDSMYQDQETTRPRR